MSKYLIDIFPNENHQENSVHVVRGRTISNENYHGIGIVLGEKEFYPPDWFWYIKSINFFSMNAKKSLLFLEKMIFANISYTNYMY